MKKSILSILLLFAVAVASAQTIYFGDGSSRDQSADKVTVIIPQGDMLTFSLASGDTIAVPFASVDSISWALPSSVATLEKGRVSIAYDEERQEVIITGTDVTPQQPAQLFNAEGKLVQTAAQNRFSVARQGTGLYIVNVKNKSNAKFMKK